VSPGPLLRRLLGDRWFPILGRLYRRVFVDLRKVVEGFPEVPEGGHILDVGAGDGELMNLLLPLNPGATATLIDVAPQVGGWLRADLRDRVEALPETSVAAYAKRKRPVDLVILSDVVHHVPLPERPGLLADLRELLGGRAAKLVVKEVEPGSWRAQIYYLADRFITGDRNVHFIRRDEVRQLVQSALPDAACQETDLYRRNPPNYCLIFSVPGRQEAADQRA